MCIIKGMVDWVKFFIYLGVVLVIGLGGEFLFKRILGRFRLRGIFCLFLLSFSLVFVRFLFKLSPREGEVIHKVSVILLVLAFSILIARTIVDLLEAFLSRGEITVPGVSILENIIKITIYIIAFLIILQTLGISITPLLTALGIGGLAVALALQDTLSNFFSGIHIILTKKIRPGDYIKLASGEEGYVEDITWRNTLIRQLPNNLIIIPNSKITSTIITNFNLPQPEISLVLKIGVSYKSDLDKVEKITLEVAQDVQKNVPGAVPDFEPVVRFSEFSDFSINLNVILRVKSFSDQFLVRHEFIKRLQKRYQEENIEIPFPIRTVYIKKD